MKCDMHLKNVVPFLWDVVPCIFIHSYNRFRRVCYLHLQGKRIKRESKYFSETYERIYKSSWSYASEGSNLQCHCSEKLKFRIKLICLKKRSDRLVWRHRRRSEDNTAVNHRSTGYHTTQWIEGAHTAIKLRAYAKTSGITKPSTQYPFVVHSFNAFLVLSEICRLNKPSSRLIKFKAKKSVPWIERVSGEIGFFSGCFLNIQGFWKFDPEDDNNKICRNAENCLLYDQP
jgi:hypothetical protein